MGGYTSISIRVDLKEKIEEYIRREGLNISVAKFVETAVTEYMNAERGEEDTHKLLKDILSEVRRLGEMISTLQRDVNDLKDRFEEFRSKPIDKIRDAFLSQRVDRFTLKGKTILVGNYSIHIPTDIAQNVDRDVLMRKYSCLITKDYVDGEEVWTITPEFAVGETVDVKKLEEWFYKNFISIVREILG